MAALPPGSRARDGQTGEVDAGTRRAFASAFPVTRSAVVGAREDGRHPDEPTDLRKPERSTVSAKRTGSGRAWCGQGRSAGQGRLQLAVLGEARLRLAKAPALVPHEAQDREELGQGEQAVGPWGAVDASGVTSDELDRRLQVQVERHNAEAAQPYQLAMSLGCVRDDPLAACSAEELLDEADRLMYKRKRERSRGHAPG